MAAAVRTWLLVTLVLLLEGCNPFAEADSMMAEYVERVARVLDADASLSPLPPVDLFPPRRIRRLEMPSLDMGMLDFLSLYGCDLQFVVGERNSVLGRVLQPLNRLRYELRFIEAARDCLPEIGREALKDEVRGAIDSKTGSLPVAVWNASWGVEELESLLTLSKGYLPAVREGPDNHTAELAAGLNALNATVAALLEGRHDQSLAFVGQVHQDWLASHRAGQLINSARLLLARLGDATTLLQTRLDGRPLCLGGRPNDQAEIVRRMFFSVYVETIQPYLARVIQGRDELFRPLENLARQQQEVMPTGFDGWYRRYLQVDQPDSLWGELDRAIKAHTRGWQALLEQCGMRPMP